MVVRLIHGTRTRPILVGAVNRYYIEATIGLPYFAGGPIVAGDCFSLCLSHLRHTLASSGYFETYRIYVTPFVTIQRPSI